jgi:TPR repeat protein
MARMELHNETVSLAGSVAADESLIELGLRCTVGDSVDFVAAHKWFNLAAMRGHAEAIRLRQEIAAQMSPAEIAAAQRAARAWLTAH